MAVTGEEGLRVETLGGPVQIVVGRFERGPLNPVLKAAADRDRAVALATLLDSLALGAPGTELAVTQALARVAGVRAPHASREELGPDRHELLRAQFLTAVATGFGKIRS